jgi:glycosyltransferase involved in cell wall biosynthesis
LPPVSAKGLRLSYYSYDSPGNPWLSGGGALRDFEILKRQRTGWAKITLFVGAFPGFRPGLRDGLEYRAIGFGRSYLLSRLAFTAVANLRVLFDRADAIGNSVSAYAPLLAGLLRPRRFFMVAHHYVGGRSSEKYSWMGRLAWLSEWLLYRFGRRLIVSNGEVASRARAMNPRLKVLQTQNGFDNALLSLASETARPPFLLYLGRFDVYMKGLDHLVAAFAALAPAVRGDLRLILAGAASPQALAAVEKLVAEAPGVPIELVPNVPEARKRELLRTCLFFVSPSRFEGWGIAALEANAAGKAVLATRADGFRDSLKDGYAALLVPVDDSAALADGLTSLIRDDGLRDRLAGNAREWAARFSWEGIAAREAQWLDAELG